MAPTPRPARQRGQAWRAYHALALLPAIGMLGGLPWTNRVHLFVPGSMRLITAATILGKNVFGAIVPSSSEHAIGIVARAMVPVLALIALFPTLQGGQAIVLLLLMGYHVVTQLFPALVISFGHKPRISAAAALSGILAGELTVAVVTLSGTYIATLAPSLPQEVKDLHVGVVALVVICVVIALVSLFAKGPSARNIPA